MYVYIKRLLNRLVSLETQLSCTTRSILSFLSSSEKCNFSFVWNKLLLSASHIGFGAPIGLRLWSAPGPGVHGGPGVQGGPRGFSKFGINPGMADYVIGKRTEFVGRITVWTSDLLQGKNDLTGCYDDVRARAIALGFPRPALTVLENRLWQRGRAIFGTKNNPSLLWRENATLIIVFTIIIIVTILSSLEISLSQSLQNIVFKYLAAPLSLVWASQALGYGGTFSHMAARNGPAGRWRHGEGD